MKLLGTGGMGSVYLATDPTVGQQVAVKLIRTELDGYADSAAAQLALERFRQEARAVASLDDLHILPLYRYGEEQTAQGPRAYMIMQYRPEGSLWDWLRRRADFARGQLQPSPAELSTGLPMNWPLTLDEAADYLQQAASALQYAHDRNIVHRDIKPANFLLRFDLHEKRAHLLLGDFGLAKVFTGGSSTQTILGTPTYMAPEQFEGAARPESDQYALAVMIYYLLAGRPPFEGDPMQLMRQHLSSPVPSITSINPQVPQLINTVLARAMAKQPEQRYPSVTVFAETFAAAVKQVQSGQGRGAQGGFPPAYAGSPVRDDLAGRSLPGTAGLPEAGPLSPKPLVLPGPAERGYNTPAPAMGYPPQTPGGGLYPTPSPSPQMGAYGAQTQFAPSSANDVYARPPSFTQGPGQAMGYQQSGYPGQSGTISRRGALGWILGGAALAAVAGGAGIYFYTRAGSPSNGTPGTPSDPALHVLKGHSAAVTSLSWLPGGNQLASGSLDQTVRLWSTTDGSAGNTIQTGAAVSALAWSPDGSTLASGAANHSLALWNASGSLIKREVGWGAAIKSFAWRKDGALLYFGTGGNGLHALQISNYKHYGHNNLGVVVNAIAQSPDGALLALALESGRVYFADLAGNWGQVASISPEHGAALSIDWSADNSMVVVGYADGYAIVYNASTRQVLYLLKHKGAVNSVAWSPNSTSSVPVLVSGSADSTVNIWAPSPSQQKQIAYSGHTDAVLAVSWNGNLLASASKDQSVILWQPPTL